MTRYSKGLLSLQVIPKGHLRPFNGRLTLIVRHLKPITGSTHTRPCPGLSQFEQSVRWILRVSVSWSPVGWGTVFSLVPTAAWHASIAKNAPCPSALVFHARALPRAMVELHAITIQVCLWHVYRIRDRNGEVFPNHFVIFWSRCV